VFLSLGAVAVPSYFKFVLENNSLTGASVLVICLLSVRNRFASKPLPLCNTTKYNFDALRDVRVLSYNIFLRPPFVKNNLDDFKNERLSEFIKHIDNYDIVSLQEIFCLANYRQHLLLSAAFEKGFKYFACSKKPTWLSGKFIDAGLLILSKFPIVETDGHIYRSGNQIDSWAAKQVIYAKVQIADALFVHVFNTHLQASYFDNHESSNKINDFARADQVTEMADFIRRKTCDSPYPTLLTGDFNINSREPGTPSSETIEYKHMMKKLDPSGMWLRDLLKEANDGQHPITYGDFHEQLEGGIMKHIPKETLLTHIADYCCAQSIDYIFFADVPSTSDMELEVVNTKIEEFLVDPKIVKCSQLSDHYGSSHRYKRKDMSKHPI